MQALLNMYLSLEHTLTNILSWRVVYEVELRPILLSDAEEFHLVAKKNK